MRTVPVLSPTHSAPAHQRAERAEPDGHAGEGNANPSRFRLATPGTARATRLTSANSSGLFTFPWIETSPPWAVTSNSRCEVGGLIARFVLHFSLALPVELEALLLPGRGGDDFASLLDLVAFEVENQIV
jgi:hypothetical protein